MAINDTLESAEKNVSAPNKVSLGVWKHTLPTACKDPGTEKANSMDETK